MGRVKDEGRGSAPHANPTPVFHVPALDGEAEARPRVRLPWNLLRWIVDRVAQPKARDVERSERLPDVARPRSRRTSPRPDRKSTRLNSSHGYISYAVFCLKKKKNQTTAHHRN